MLGISKEQFTLKCFNGAHIVAESNLTYERIIVGKWSMRINSMHYFEATRSHSCRAVTAGLCAWAVTLTGTPHVKTYENNMNTKWKHVIRIGKHVFRIVKTCYHVYENMFSKSDNRFQIMVMVIQLWKRLSDFENDVFRSVKTCFHIPENCYQTLKTCFHFVFISFSFVFTGVSFRRLPNFVYLS